jgi:hypothetical protein
MTIRKWIFLLKVIVVLIILLAYLLKMELDLLGSAGVVDDAARWINQKKMELEDVNNNNNEKVPKMQVYTNNEPSIEAEPQTYNHCYLEKKA